MTSLREHFEAVAAMRDCITGRKTLTEAYRLPCDYGPDIKKLTKLVESTKFSPAYDAEQDRILKKFKAQLAAHPDLKYTVANWPHMRRRDQTYFLEQCAAMLARIQSEGGITVLPAAIQWRGDKDFMKYEGRAYYDLDDPHGTKDLIEIRAVCRSGSDDIAEALDTIVHEQTHVYQAFLARACLFEKIDTAHPLYQDAALASFTLAKGYVDSDLREAYRAQCVEQDAFRAGHAVRDFMKAARRKMTADNDNTAQLLTGVAVAGLIYLAGRALARPG